VILALSLLAGAVLPLFVVCLFSPLSQWFNACVLHQDWGWRDFACEWFGQALFGVLFWLLVSLPLFAAGAGISAVIAAIVLWWSRPGRRRAPRELGAKSRARLAALAHRAREALRPRRVLQPQPGGAR
jgi:hypothetical protein